MEEACTIKGTSREWKVDCLMFTDDTTLEANSDEVLCELEKEVDS